MVIVRCCRNYFEMLLHGLSKKNVSWLRDVDVMRRDWTCMMVMLQEGLVERTWTGVAQQGVTHLLKFMYF